MRAGELKVRVIKVARSGFDFIKAAGMECIQLYLKSVFEVHDSLYKKKRNFLPIIETDYVIEESNYADSLEDNFNLAMI